MLKHECRSIMNHSLQNVFSIGSILKIVILVPANAVSKPPFPSKLGNNQRF